MGTSEYTYTDNGKPIPKNWELIVYPETTDIIELLAVAFLIKQIAPEASFKLAVQEGPADPMMDYASGGVKGGPGYYFHDLDNVFTWAMWEKLIVNRSLLMLITLTQIKLQRYYTTSYMLEEKHYEFEDLAKCFNQEISYENHYYYQGYYDKTTKLSYIKL